MAKGILNPAVARDVTSCFPRVLPQSAEANMDMSHLKVIYVIYISVAGAATLDAVARLRGTCGRESFEHKMLLAQIAGSCCG